MPVAGTLGVAPNPAKSEAVRPPEKLELAKKANGGQSVTTWFLCVIVQAERREGHRCGKVHPMRAPVQDRQQVAVAAQSC